MIVSISRSSIALSSSAEISPRLALARAPPSAAPCAAGCRHDRRGRAVRSFMDFFIRELRGANPVSGTAGSRFAGMTISGPTPLRQFHDHPQLGPLLVLGQHVAFLGRGEAALRRQASWSSATYFVASSMRRLIVVLLLQRPALRGDQAEHHAACCPWARSATARSRRRDRCRIRGNSRRVDLAEQLLGDGLVAARRDQGGAEIAAAECVVITMSAGLPRAPHW